MAPAFALAAGAALFVITAALLAPAAIDNSSTGLRVGAAVGRGESASVTLAFAALIAGLGTLAGVPLGLALRRAPRSRATLALRLASVLPLAVPPLLIALGLTRLFEASTALDGAVEAWSFSALLTTSSLALLIAHLPATICIVIAVVSTAGAGADASLVETARLLGAGRVRRFIRFEFPAMASVLLLAFVLSFLHAATSITAIDRLGDRRVVATESTPQESAPEVRAHSLLPAVPGPSSGRSAA